MEDVSAALKETHQKQDTGVRRGQEALNGRPQSQALRASLLLDARGAAENRQDLCLLEKSGYNGEHRKARRFCCFRIKFKPFLSGMGAQNRAVQ